MCHWEQQAVLIFISIRTVARCAFLVFGTYRSEHENMFMKDVWCYVCCVHVFVYLSCQPPVCPQSQAADSYAYISDDSLLDDVFFDTPTPTSYMTAPFSHARMAAAMEPIAEKSVSDLPEKDTLAGADQGDSGVRVAAPSSGSESVSVPVKVEMDEETDKEPQPPSDEWRYVLWPIHARA